MNEELCNNWGLWVFIGVYLLSAGVLGTIKLVYNDRCGYSWGWVLIPFVNWVAFLFFFFFIFLDGIIESFKKS